MEAARNILLDAIERDKVRILTNEMTVLCVHCCTDQWSVICAVARAGVVVVRWDDG